MKEPYREGLASHPDPESCRYPREGGIGSVDRGECGLCIELRNQRHLGADLVNWGGRQHQQRRYWRVSAGPGAVGDHSACSKLHAREPGGLMRSPSGGTGPHGEADEV